MSEEEPLEASASSLKNEGRKRRKATLQTLAAIYAAPGRSYLTNDRTQQQLETLVLSHLRKLRDEGYTRAELCASASCALCNWNSSSVCSLCGLKFAKASKATGGGTGSRVFPLFIPKFSDDDGSQLLHIEVSMLCSEKCTDKLLSRPLAEAGWKRMVRGFGRPLLQGNVLRQWFFLALSLYTMLWTSAFRSLASLETYCMLTTWNTLGQVLFYALCCWTSLLDACGLARVARWSRRATSLVFNAAFVLAVVTMGAFWLVSFIDPELVFPPKFDQPDFLNVMQHTLPAAYMVIEMITVCHGRYDALAELVVGMLTPAAYLAFVLSARAGWLAWLHPAWLLPSGALPHPWLEVFTAEAAERAAAQGKEISAEVSGLLGLVMYTLCAGSIAHWAFRKLRSHWWKGRELV